MTESGTREMMKTTLYSVLCIAIRLGAVLMAVGILERAPGIFFFANAEGHFQVLALFLEGAGLLLALALWIWPNMLTWCVMGRNKHEILESSISAAQVQHIAFSIVGVWLFIDGVSGCLGHAFMILLIKQEMAAGALPGMGLQEEWRWLIQFAATAVAGAALTLGSRGLVGLLHRLRAYPHYRSTETDPDTSTTQDG